ncbi:MAG TPA: glutamate-5-semialdehyde dehydrogenase [Candidatus Thermoplasmatota archaeon]|nr:glutamate-5-semialdehyde dehydrogenase [Candidatus Thermoplasmatota archaeon]
MTPGSIRDVAVAARRAAHRLAASPDAERRAALEAFSRLLLARRAEVEGENARDLAAAEALAARGELAKVLVDRLSIKGSKLDAAAEMVRAVAVLPDPLNQTLRATLLDDALRLYQVTVPIGVVACAFESRPDAAVQMAALAIRSGNAILLKGGREAASTNRVVVALAREALRETGLPEDAVALLEAREDLMALLALDDLVDLVVPRGSSDFVKLIQRNTRIPVMGHAEGVCHLYVDRAADLGKALHVSHDAKLDYPAACNAVECFLIHREKAARFVPLLVSTLAVKGVEVRGDDAVRALAPQAKEATEADWGREFGDLACAMRVVDSLEEAIAHINRYGSKHTDGILTEDKEAARRFVQEVDSAGVFVNASTRFADGYRYGLGAEVGISTGKLHARGPVGLEGLTSTKWVLHGEGHAAAPYRGDAPRSFKHARLQEEYRGE